MLKDKIKEHKTAVSRKYEQSLVYKHLVKSEWCSVFRVKDGAPLRFDKVLQQQKSTGPCRI